MQNKDSHANMQAQQKGGAQRMLDRARGHLEDAERRIRAAMRIHPRPKVAHPAVPIPHEPHVSSAAPELDRYMSQKRAKSPYVPDHKKKHMA